MRLVIISFFIGAIAAPSVRAQDGAGESEPVATDEAQVDSAPLAERAVDPRRQEALEAFRTAAQAAEEGRWRDALPDFERAYTLSGAPTALFNVALTLRSLGRHREARDAFSRFIDAHPTDDSAADALRFRAEEQARVARLELSGLPTDEPPLRLRFDGAPTEIDARAPIIETDAGTHALTAAREGFHPFEWQGALADGEIVQLDLTLEALPTPEAPIVAEGDNVLESPWLWIIIGLVVAGGAITAGLLLDDAAQIRAGGPNVVRVP